MNIRFKFSDSIRNNDHIDNASKELIFSCLNGKDVIASQVSDHHPTIHNRTLFWNIMMQARIRKDGDKISYNNGFALIESDREYQNRLKIIAAVIAEIIAENPEIEVISICEGPIKTKDITVLINTLHQYHHMKHFKFNDVMDTQNTTTTFPNWGLMLLTNQSYQAQLVDNCSPQYLANLHKLGNRVQIWRLSNNQQKRFIILAHLPFSNDTYITNHDNLSTSGKLYCDLFNGFLKQYSESDMIICADFNFNPNLLGSYLDRLEDKICPNNSILLSSPISQNKFSIDSVTVDGILLSRQAKQKAYLSRSPHSLFYNLSREHQFIKAYRQSHLVDNRMNDIETQRAYDERYGIVPYDGRFK